MTTYRALHRLERLAELLVPPAAREHVLGDVAESSASNREYLIHLSSALPGVVWSQIRRRVGIAGLLFTAIIGGYVLGAAQAYFNSAFLNDATAVWGRLAVVWLVWVVGCVLSAAYGPADKPHRSSNALLAVTIFVTMGTAAALRVPLIGVAAGIGVVLAVSLALYLVLSMPWLKVEKLQQPLSLETLPDRAHAFQRMVWWRNARECAVGIVLLVIQTLKVWRAESIWDEWDTLLLMGGILFVIGYLQFRANSHAVPETQDAETLLRFHRIEIVRQRDILRAVPFWYLLPFVPGLTAGAFRSGQGLGAVLILAIMAGVFVFIWKLNSWGAGWLETKLQEMNTLQEKLEKT